MQKTVIIILIRSKEQITLLIVKMEIKHNLKLSISWKMKSMFLKVTKGTWTTETFLVQYHEYSVRN